MATAASSCSPRLAVRRGPCSGTGPATLFALGRPALALCWRGAFWEDLTIWWWSAGSTFTLAPSRRLCAASPVAASIALSLQVALASFRSRSKSSPLRMLFPRPLPRLPRPQTLCLQTLCLGSTLKEPLRSHCFAAANRHRCSPLELLTATHSQTGVCGRLHPDLRPPLSGPSRYEFP